MLILKGKGFRKRKETKKKKKINKILKQWGGGGVCGAMEEVHTPNFFSIMSSTRLIIGGDH